MLDRHLFHLVQELWRTLCAFSPLFLNQLQDVRLALYAHATCRISGPQAEELQRKALAGREAQLGAHHPDTLTSISHLAVVLEKQGKLDEAGPRSLGWREVTFLWPGLMFES